jgi:uncharacterized membrane protein YhaH (DUF805 family)
MPLMFEPLRKYADFQGRASRGEYWQFVLFLVLVHLAVTIVGGGGGFWFGMWGWGWGHHHYHHMWGNPFSGLVHLGYLVFCLYVLIPSLAVAVRRLHDTDRSAWWLLLAIIPFFGELILLIFMILEGTRGANRFGPDPGYVEDPAAAI